MTIPKEPLDKRPEGKFKQGVLAMEQKMIRFVLDGAILMVFLTFVAIKVFGGELTRPCPQDGEDASSTGRTKLVLSCQNGSVNEFKHEGDLYEPGDVFHRHPQHFKHVFWVCEPY